MRDINLLPQQSNKAQKRKASGINRVIIIAITAVLMVGGGFAADFFLAEETSKSQDEITKITIDKKQYSQVGEWNTTLAARQSRIKNMEDTLKAAQSGYPVSTKLMEDISAAMDTDVSVSGFGSSENGEISITGESKTTLAVAAFTKRLMNNSRFSAVSIKSIEVATTDKNSQATGYRFSLTMRWKGGAEK